MEHRYIRRDAPLAAPRRRHVTRESLVLPGQSAQAALDLFGAGIFYVVVFCDGAVSMGKGLDGSRVLRVLPGKMSASRRAAAALN